MTDSKIPHSPPDTAESSTLRKAAVLIASLPLEEATHLTRSLGQDRLDRLASAIAYVHEIPEKEQRGLAQELVESRQTPTDGLSQTACTTREYGEAIDRSDPAIVAKVLQNELPQTVAMVLSQMDPAAAANVLRRLTTDRQLSVVKRMAVLQDGHEATIADLLKTVSQSVRLRSAPLRQAAGGEAFLAHVISSTDQATERALLENLAEEDRGLVDRLLQRIYLLKDSRRPSRVEDAEDKPQRRAG